MSVETGTAAVHIPPRPTLPKLREAAAGCRACPLYKTGTQTVFGEGTRSAELLIVGEQPGDKEDVEGRPFVGPAGRLLDSGLEQAGIERTKVYVTNVVKHFKWVAKGKRRIHKKPNAGEISACKPWLESEIDVVKPRVILCLGATAAQALLGKSFKVTERRGEFVDWEHDPLITATVHPSSLLRLRDRSERDTEMGRFVADLNTVARQLSA